MMNIGENPGVTTPVLVALISAVVPAVSSVVISLIRERYALARERLRTWKGRATGTDEVEEESAREGEE